MNITINTDSGLKSQFNLSMLSPEARSLVNRAAANPSIFQQFIQNPESAWVEYGQGINLAERCTLELFAELFVPSTSIEIFPKVVMDSVWVSNR